MDKRCFDSDRDRDEIRRFAASIDAKLATSSRKFTLYPEHADRCGSTFLNTAKSSSRLCAEVDKLEEDHRSLQREVTELGTKEVIGYPTWYSAWHTYFRRDRENGASERKILLLEIENRLLRSDRGLPPGDNKAEDL